MKTDLERPRLDRRSRTPLDGLLLEVVKVTREIGEAEGGSSSEGVCVIVREEVARIGRVDLAEDCRAR